MTTRTRRLRKSLLRSWRKPACVVAVIFVGLVCYSDLWECSYCPFCGRAEVRAYCSIYVPFTDSVIAKCPRRVLRRYGDGFLADVLDPDRQCRHQWTRYSQELSAPFSPCGHPPSYPRFPSLREDGGFKDHLARKPETVNEMRNLLRARLPLHLEKLVYDEHHVWQMQQSDGRSPLRSPGDS